MSAELDSVMFQDFTLEDLEKSFTTLLKVIECSVCLETVQPDMVQCVKGHVICSKCKGDQDKCPTCKQPFSNVEQPSVLAQLVEAIPHQCKHTNCTTLVRAASDHEVYCGWRLTQCRLEQCAWSGPVREIVNHVKEVHPKTRIFTENSLPGIIKNFCVESEYGFYSCYLLYDQFFWEITKHELNMKKFIKSFLCVPDNKPKHEIFLEIEYGPNILSETKSITSIKLNQDPDVNIEEENFVSLPSFMLPNFINEKGTLKWKMSVTTQK